MGGGAGRGGGGGGGWGILLKILVIFTHFLSFNVFVYIPLQNKLYVSYVNLHHYDMESVMASPHLDTQITTYCPTDYRAIDRHNHIANCRLFRSYISTICRDGITPVFVCSPNYNFQTTGYIIIFKDKSGN